MNYIEAAIKQAEALVLDGYRAAAAQGVLGTADFDSAPIEVPKMAGWYH